MTKVKPIPDGMHSVTPHLICAGARGSIEVRPIRPIRETVAQAGSQQRKNIS